jgi:hypothetical protein
MCITQLVGASFMSLEAELPNASCSNFNEAHKLRRVKMLRVM